MKDFILFWINEWDRSDYLPSNVLKKVPNREWLTNICKYVDIYSIGNSLSNSKFQDYVRSVLSIRENLYFESRSMEV